MDPTRAIADAVCDALAGVLATPGGRPVLLAVSGGADSLALALGFARLRDAGVVAGDEVVLGHVDHGACASGADTPLRVRRLAARLRFGHRARRIAPGVRAGEAELREARYRELLDMARETGAGSVWTAHHADDDVETVLLRAIRGTAGRGLAGVPRLRWLETGRVLVRPFLHLRRNSLLACAETTDLPAVDDPGNRDLSRARNRLRHVLLPEWRRRLGEDLDERLITLAAAARRRAVRDEVAAGRWLASHARVVDASAIEVPVAPCENADETLRLLHRSLVGSDPGRTWLRRVRALERTGARVVGGGPVAAERRPGTLLLARTTAGLPQDVALSTGRGWVTFGDTGWMLRADSAPAARGHTLTVSVGAIEAPLRARARRPGDRVGDGDSSRSVGGLMQARGLSRHERDRWPLVVDARDRIVWIPDVAPPEPAVRGDSIVLSARRCTGGIDLGRSSYWFALASEEDPPVRVP